MKKPYFWARFFAVIMFIGFSLPGGTIRDISNLSKFLSFLRSAEVLHTAVFGIFVWLLFLGAYKISRDHIPYFKIFLLAMGFGFFIEIWQYLLPYRSFDGMDLIYNFFGIGIVIFIFTFIKARGWFFLRKPQ